MKRLLLVIITIVVCSGITAQAPQGFNYQAILRNPDGTVRANETVTLQISIMDEIGALAYLEVHNTQTNEFGLVNLVIGQGTTSGDFSMMNWSAGPYFIDITVDGVNLGSSPLLSVPYALYAESGNEGPQGEIGPQGIPGIQGEPGDSKWGDVDDGISYSGGRVGIGTSSPTDSLDVNGSLRVRGDLIVDGEYKNNDLLERIQFLEVLNGIDKVFDIDGNEYRTIRIGEQIWMAENLKVTRYPNGDAIFLIKDSTSWDALADADKAFCWFDNDTLNFTEYGALYTWSSAMNGAASCDYNPSWVQGVCPDGFHLPSEAEWQELEVSLGMSEAEAGSSWRERGESVGQKLKESGTLHWKWPNEGANNESGFTALPGRQREDNGNFWGEMGHAGYFWSSAEQNDSKAWIRSLYYDNYIQRDGFYKKSGFSVRCVKGAGSVLFPNVFTSAITEITTNSVSLGGEVSSDGGTDVTARGVCWSTSPNPLAIQNATTDGIGQGKFTSIISGLIPGTKYYVRAYATNSKATSYGKEYSFMTWTGSVTDFDGNSYATILIGSQNWMAENLRVTHDAEGTEIPLVESDDSWELLDYDDRAYCWVNGDASQGNIYGALYTWATASNGDTGGDSNPSGIQGVCPDGWHLPSDLEWKELEMYLGMSQETANTTFTRGTDEGGKLKETGTFHWNSPNTGATNESGFTALPGGYRPGYLSGEGNSAVFWTVSGYDAQTSWYRSMSSGDAGIRRGRENKNRGLSVRCVED